jgi:L,D-transpeptidase YcbB
MRNVLVNIESVKNSESLIYRPRNGMFFLFLILIWVLGSCQEAEQSVNDLVEQPVQMDDAVTGRIPLLLERARNGNPDPQDSLLLHSPELVSAFYQQRTSKPVWSTQEQLTPLADSMLQFINAVEVYGLYPDFYHSTMLQQLFHRFAADSSGTSDKRKAVLWARTDLLLTDAYLTLARHLHRGRLMPDSIYRATDSSNVQELYINLLKQTLQDGQVKLHLQSLEPSQTEYHNLKKALGGFLDTARLNQVYTYLQYPYKDSILFVQSLVKRLKEEGLLSWQQSMPDSLQLKEVLKVLQKKAGLTVDGRFGQQVVSWLNNTDPEKFRRIAINLDRYKLMTQQMPDRFIWVNLPGYYLRVWDHDSLVMESKVIVGKSKTRTPLLNSSITDMVTYPQWTIPNSIIVKEILPALKRNPGYLAKKGYMLLTWEGELVDPYLVDWSKYTKGIPYKIVQGSGDDNALGILKFNFHNKYSVYMHDTNQRYLFKNQSRALSHGCVRVQEWQKLAWYVLQVDSLAAVQKNLASPGYTLSDSVRAWLSRKERRVIPVKSRIPVYFRYFTAEGDNQGSLMMYPDIYGEDAIVRHLF